MLSFWEQDALPRHDVVIVGGGLVGLSTAVELKQRRPALSVLVLERGLLPTGATGRNAGFACFGSLTEILSDIQRMGRDAALALVERRFRGLHKLRQRMGDAAIGYEHFGGYELLMEPQVHALHELPTVNAWLRPSFKEDVFQLLKAKNGVSAATMMGFNNKQVRAVLKNPFEGQLHSGRLMNALLRMALDAGVEIRTGAEVVEWEEAGNGVELRARRGSLPELVPFRAGQAVFCTNGFSSRLLPELGITPARGQILVTEPIQGLAWKGCFHLDEGYVYFRNVTGPAGDRVLLGGARNLAFSAEETMELDVTDTIQRRLEQLLHDTILPGRRPAVTHRWAGLMGFAPDKQPIARRVSRHATMAFGCNGMGVALGSLIAEEAAKLVAEG